MTGAQSLVNALEKEGVSIVYGYPGAAICPFFDALLASTKVRAVLVRQEQNAAHSASGYARVTGKPGVCVVTSGPGATNLITGLATAYMDSIPLVAITGQVRSDLIGRDVFQEADITGAAEPFCKHSYLVKKAEDLPRIIKEAFYIASTGRPGPVLIDLPIDIQNTEIKSEYPNEVDIKGYKPTFKGHSLQIKRVAEAVSKSKKPVICAGGGIFSSSAKAELLAFAEKCNIPVVTTMMGIGAIATVHPLHLGMLGSHGKFAANKAIFDADLIIIAGARVGDRAMAAPNQIAKHATIIHIDIDPAEIGKNIESEIPVVGDLKNIFQELFEKTQPADTNEWVKNVQGLKHTNQKSFDVKEGFIEPRSFMRTLSHKMDATSVLVADVGQNQIWSANNFEITKGRFLTTGGMGTMGYSIPAAVGVKTAKPELQVVAVCGDGSFQMSMMELGTIIQENAKVKIIIMRNNRLGMVREIQSSVYGSRYTVTNLDANPDFIALASAYGIKAMSVTSNNGAEKAIDEMLNFDGAFLLECAIDPMESSM